MASTSDLEVSYPVLPIRSIPTKFELLITCNPPVLESLLSQIPTETILRLYHTSYLLRDFLQNSPTAWRYVSWRLFQPAATTATITNNHTGTGPRQSSNYALDQLLIYVINPFSTRLVSLELDNTAVSGGTLTQTVLILRRDTLQHVSVRGCKNVSLKYHINPWLQIHALARERSTGNDPPGYENLALKSLYTYRCRHHRRRPYLPSSLTRKESDSEPTHELVLTCHKLGIWTDTAWCTTPGARCYRRRGYVTMRVPQDPREVWVVYDRLWRSRNWLGPPEDGNGPNHQNVERKRKRDCRSWEFEEEATNGEAIGNKREGKATPAHLRRSHQQFVDNISCQNCADPILERCEQCSVMMHCTGCRKTLCSSCAFDRPYLRNKNCSEEERNKFWWAPGCAVSPCSMQDQDSPPAMPGANAPNGIVNVLPNIKFRWCCTEPVFSGGGGITFGNGWNRDSDRIRAVPLKPGHGWEDPDFCHDLHDESDFGESEKSFENSTGSIEIKAGPGNRWSSLDDLFKLGESGTTKDGPSLSVPRILCDECYGLEKWKIKCRACSVALCLRHDVQDRLKVRICGYKDLVLEKSVSRRRQHVAKILKAGMLQILEEQNIKLDSSGRIITPAATALPVPDSTAIHQESNQSTQIMQIHPGESSSTQSDTNISIGVRVSTPETDLNLRPLSRGSSSTGPPSRTTSPTPSTRSVPEPNETNNIPRSVITSRRPPPDWRGCQSFFCPAIRSPGDHRRRCIAVMRQCTDCKIYVCSDCISNIDPPCPCKGCRSSNSAPTSTSGIEPPPPPAPSQQQQSSTPSTEAAKFVCPICRWTRRLNGKCKRRIDIANTTEASTKKKGKRRERMRTITDPSSNSSQNTNLNSNAAQDEAIESVGEFFSRIELESSSPSPMLPSSSSSQSQDTAAPADGLDQSNEQQDENNIHELEDMGVLARDLIRRIQRLRGQFQPGSLAALALPDVRIDNLDSHDEGGDGDAEE